ncbi:hypothetical protein WOLCODRAFT_150773 [Wolfiporia cocos MD-104 SS10]|uniref:Uncharacterized protein n=1 Tax=Wolfiporia cocos (strain MD-104) TaxID=742152 RepID=A0A2H3JVL0_WOLCO|nr:hypothetical protein WOLCODRAFT_150773 [Wolfiporia cocos MD-104 SS10]
MASRNRSTVHDLTALRLHPDGSRVNSTEVSRSLGASKGSYAVCDSRGRWIATDAGGGGNVKVRYARPPSERGGRGDRVDLADDDDEDGGKGGSISSSGYMGKGKGKQRDDPESEVKGRKARKRKRFLADYSFLDGSALLAEVDDASWSELPNPSSDLLKCLHHFASNYYTAMGRLSVRPTPAPQKKRRKRRKERDEDENSGSDADDDEARPSEKEWDEEGEDFASIPRRSRGTPKRQNTDMHKIFDGSALVVIGMLMQEHIRQILSSEVEIDPKEEDEDEDKDEDKDEDEDEEDEEEDEEGEGEGEGGGGGGGGHDVKHEEGSDSQEERPRGSKRSSARAVPHNDMVFIDDNSEDEDFVPST